MGETGEAYIVVTDHLIRSTSRFWTEAKEQYKQDVKITGVPQKTIELRDRLNTTIDLQKIPNSIVESAIAGDTGITPTNNNYRGKEVFTTYGPLDIRGLDWALIAEMEVQEVYAPSRRLLIILSIAGVIFLLLSAAVADLASKLLLKPISRLIEKTNQIAAGEADTEISLDENNEFGELAESISGVASNLDRTSQELSTEKQANEALLHNILAPAIAQRKNKGELVIADKLNKATIVYAHLVGVEYNIDFKHGLPDRIPQVSEDRQSEKIAFLRSLSCFFTASDLQIEQLASKSQFEIYGEGEPIVREGIPDCGLYAIYKGRVKSSITDNEGLIQTDKELGVGNVFGEMTIFPGETSPITVVAEDDVEVIVIPDEEIVRLIEVNSQFGLEMVRFIEERKKAMALLIGSVLEENRDSLSPQMMKHQTNGSTQYR